MLMLNGSSINILNSSSFQSLSLFSLFLSTISAITSSLTSSSVSFSSSSSSAYTSSYNSSFVLHLILLWLLKHSLHNLSLPLVIFFITDVWFILQKHLSTPLPISPPPGDCPESSWLMSPLYLFSRTTSSPSYIPPSLISYPINDWYYHLSTSSSTTSLCLSVGSRTHDILKTYTYFQGRKQIANQFYVRHSNLLYLSRQIQIIKGQFPDFSRKSSRSLTWIAVYCRRIWIWYCILHIKVYAPVVSNHGKVGPCPRPWRGGGTDHRTTAISNR